MPNQTRVTLGSTSLDSYAVAAFDPKSGTDERGNVAVETLKILSGELLDSETDGFVHRRIIRTAVKLELESGTPTMRGTLARIRTWGTGVVDDRSMQGECKSLWINCCQVLADHLEKCSHSPLGRLLFTAATPAA